MLKVKKIRKFWIMLIQLWTSLISSDPAMNIAGANTYMCAQKHCKNISSNSCNVFFLFTGFILVFFTVFLF